MRKWGIVIHGKYGSPFNDSLHQQWESKPEVFVVRYTHKPGDAVQLVQELVQMGCTHLLSVGGDGTLNECVNGAMQCNPRPTLMVYPNGTGNDFVRSLPHPSFDSVLEAMSSESTVTIDIPHAKFIGHQGLLEDRYFVNVADIGLGGEVVQHIATSKRRWGPLITYQKAILRSMLSFQSRPCDYQLEEDEYTHNISMMAFCNGTWFGNGIGIAPLANLTDGTLQVIEVREIGLLDYLFQLPKLRKAAILKHPEVACRQAKSMRILSVGWPIDMDGEFVGTTPLEIEVEPLALTFLALPR